MWVLNERNLSVAFHALFSAWMLSFLFEGKILYSLTAASGFPPQVMVFGGILAMFFGLLLGGVFVKTKRAAKRLYLVSFLVFMIISPLFLGKPSALWPAAIVFCSLLAGSCVAAWGHYLKSGTPKEARIKTIADMLILSNLLMIALNMICIHYSARFSLLVATLLLALAFLFALRLPVENGPSVAEDLEQEQTTPKMVGLFALLFLFITVITINSGLMYQVTEPAFGHLDTLTCWYWALPYILALVIVRNLPARTNRAYMLYVAMAMIGFSFIGFVLLDRSAPSYIIVNTLMMGSCGVYDLFWWSILGEMLDFHENPAKILGAGLSANILGIFLGGLIGSALATTDPQNIHATLLALTVVCVGLILLPPLHKKLSLQLKDHVFLATFSESPLGKQVRQEEAPIEFGGLSKRESEVAGRLLQGKTYKMIAGELFISENTVKYFVKNIYSKYGVQSRGELIEIILEAESPEAAAGKEH